MSKRRKYVALLAAFTHPIALEGTGVYGVSTTRILKDFGRRLVEATGEPVWFHQSLG